MTTVAGPTSDKQENITCEFYYFYNEQDNVPIRNGETAIYVGYWALLIIPGVLLNCLTIVAILRKKTLRNVISNRYIVILAVVDGTNLLFIGGSILVNLLTDGITKKCNTICWMLMWVEQWLKYSSLTILGVIAVDRYRMVTRVTQYRTNKRFRISIAIGLIGPLLYLLILMTTFESTGSIISCYEKHLRNCFLLPTYKHEWVYNAAVHLDLVVLVLLQVFLIAGYSVVVMSLSRSQFKWGKEASHRSAEMMVFVCGSCILTSLPSTLYNLFTALEIAPVQMTPGDFFYFKWIYWAFHISSAVNPIIYIHFNKYLLTELKYLIRCSQSPKIHEKPDKVH